MTDSFDRRITRRLREVSNTAERLAALGLLEGRQLGELLLDGLLGLGDGLLLGRVGLGALGLDLVLLELDRLLVDGDDLRQLVARGARAVNQLAVLGTLDHAGRAQNTLVGALVHLEVAALLQVGAGRAAALVLADDLELVDLGLQLLLDIGDGRLLGGVLAAEGIELLLLVLEGLAVDSDQLVELVAVGRRAVDEVAGLGTLDGLRTRRRFGSARERERERRRGAMRVGGSIGSMGRDGRAYPGGVQLASISTRIDVRIASLLQLGEGGQGHQRDGGGGGGDGRAAGVEAVDAQGVAGRDAEGSDERLVQHFVGVECEVDLGTTLCCLRLAVIEIRILA